MRFLSLLQTDSGATLALWPADRQTGNFNALAGFIYPTDTTGGVIIATLPPAPAQGDRTLLYDVGGTFDINKLTIARNGNTIMDLAEDMDVTTRYARLQLMFDVTRGWRLIA